jgi:hypothetical protein
MATARGPHRRDKSDPGKTSKSSRSPPADMLCIITVTPSQAIDLSGAQSPVDRVLLSSRSHCSRLLTGGLFIPHPTKLVLSRHVRSPMQMKGLTTHILHSIDTPPIMHPVPPLRRAGRLYLAPMSSAGEGSSGREMAVRDASFAWVHIGPDIICPDWGVFTIAEAPSSGRAACACDGRSSDPRWWG